MFAPTRRHASGLLAFFFGKSSLFQATLAAVKARALCEAADKAACVAEGSAAMQGMHTHLHARPRPRPRAPTCVCTCAAAVLEMVAHGIDVLQPFGGAVLGPDEASLADLGLSSREKLLVRALDRLEQQAR